MNEKEIITAWKCCSNVITSSCKECPLHLTHNANCVRELMRVSLDLYNRQKAENERLQKEAERWKNAMMGECMLSACPNKEQLKSEAYREFAERLKKTCFNAIYRIPKKGKTVEISEVNKYITDLLQNDIPILIEHIKKELTESNE